MSKEDKEAPKIIRNRFRGQRAAQVHQGPYQPEYERLGLDPIVYKLNQADVMAAAPKVKRSVPVPQTTRRGVPSAPAFVHSGQNEEHIWTEGLQPPAQSKKVIIVEDEEENEDEVFDYESIPDPPEEEFSHQYRERELNQEDTSQEFLLSNVSPNDYVLLCGNDVIEAGSKELIQITIENLLMKDDNLYHKLCVLKRVDISAGVTILD